MLKHYRVRKGVCWGNLRAILSEALWNSNHLQRFVAGIPMEFEIWPMAEHGEP